MLRGLSARLDHPFAGKEIWTRFLDRFVGKITRINSKEIRFLKNVRR